MIVYARGMPCPLAPQEGLGARDEARYILDHVTWPYSGVIFPIDKSDRGIRDPRYNMKGYRTICV